MKLTQLKNKHIAPLREKLWLANDKKCPLLGIEVPPNKLSLDHVHKLKSEAASPQKGTIRNSIHFSANVMEGKITNSWRRCFGSDESNHPISLPDFLRNLADYLEAGSYHEDDEYFIHPSEAVKPKKVKKNSFNKMLKEFKIKYPKRKMPAYPKSAKLTKGLEELFNEFNITDYFMK